MALNDPMLDPTFKYSINRFPGDGATTVWNLNFAGGYLRREHVKAYTEDALGNTVERTLEFLSDNQIRVTPAVTLGRVLVVYRDTPKDKPLVDFSDGSVVNENNLDLVTEQSIFGVAEMVDRFVEIASGNEQAIVQSALALEKAGTAETAAVSAETAAAAASAVASEVALEFDALVETVNDIAGDDLSSIPRLDTPQEWSARQQFSELAVQSGNIGIEFTPQGAYRLNTGTGWGAYSTINSWASLTGVPSAFPPAPHEHVWTDISNRPSSFPPSAHTHAFGDLTGIPSSFPPSAHSHTWNEIQNRPDVAINGSSASFSSLSAEGYRVPRVQVITGTPSGGSNGDVWFVVAS